MRAEAEKIVLEIEKVIAGKRGVIVKILTTLLAGGHVLLDDVPGVGKTTLATALSRAVGLEYQRVQFTPDLLPSDLVGFSMYNRKTGEFEYRPGALSQASLLLCDEINRASSKTQSALLEAMEENQVTVDGRTYPLKDPFMVIATENSVGTAGTQLLPYAQMDRFMTRLTLGYPDYEAQMTMLRARRDGNPMDRVEAVADRESFLAMRRGAERVTVREPVWDYITRLTLASRDLPQLEIGISPRGALFLDRMARAHAWMEDRDYVTGGDVQAVFPDVCAHRVLLRDPSSGETAEDVLRGLLKSVENPDRHSRGLLKK